MKKSVLSIGMAAIMLVATLAVMSTSATAASTVNAPVKGLPAAAQNVVGGLPYTHLVVTGYDGALWTRTSTGGADPTVAANWPGGWRSLGGVSTSDPAIAAQFSAVAQGGRIDVFVRGTDGALWVKSSLDNGVTWGDWSSWGGYLADGTGPAATTWTDGTTWRTTAFVVGSDLALWTKWMDNANPQQWQSQGGIVTATPGASSAGAGTTTVPTGGLMDVVVRGSTGQLWWKHFETGGFGGWNLIYGVDPADRDAPPQMGYSKAMTAPALLSSADPALPVWEIDLIVAGTNGMGFAQAWEPDGATALGWNTLWTPLLGSISAGTSVSGPGPADTFYAFIAGANGHVYATTVTTDVAPNNGFSAAAWTDLFTGP